MADNEAEFEIDAEAGTGIGEAEAEAEAEYGPFRGLPLILTLRPKLGLEPVSMASVPWWIDPALLEGTGEGARLRLNMIYAGRYPRESRERGSRRGGESGRRGREARLVPSR